MITASTMYALVEHGVVVAKGSAKAMRQLQRTLNKGLRAIGQPAAVVWNAPSARIGDHLPKGVTQ